MGKRFPPQLRASLFRPLLQQRRPLGSPAANASPGHVRRCFASAASTGSAVKTPAWPRNSASRTSALAVGPFVPFTVARWKNEQCYNLTPACAYSTSSGSSGVVVVESAEDFENALNKVEEGAQPAIFYFSATWCGPCKLLAPVVDELSKTYPNCVTYKIDIDMESIQNKLSELGISAVPTLNFYKDGKMAAKVVGADVQKVKGIMDEFYK